MTAPYVLDISRTAELYRAIAMDSPARMRDLLRRVRAASGIVSASEAAWKQGGNIYEDAEQLHDVSETFEILALSGEALDRDANWAVLGVWVPTLVCVTADLAQSR